MNVKELIKDLLTEASLYEIQTRPTIEENPFRREYCRGKCDALRHAVDRIKYFCIMEVQET